MKLPTAPGLSAVLYVSCPMSIFKVGFWNKLILSFQNAKGIKVELSENVDYYLLLFLLVLDLIYSLMIICGGFTLGNLLDLFRTAKLTYFTLMFTLYLFGTNTWLKIARKGSNANNSPFFYDSCFF